MPGGDFRRLLSEVGRFPEKEAKFYIAEMIAAVLLITRNNDESDNDIYLQQLQAET